MPNNQAVRSVRRPVYDLVIAYRGHVPGDEDRMRAEVVMIRGEERPGWLQNVRTLNKANWARPVGLVGLATLYVMANYHLHPHNGVAIELTGIGAGLLIFALSFNRFYGYGIRAGFADGVLARGWARLVSAQDIALALKSALVNLSSSQLQFATDGEGTSTVVPISAITRVELAKARGIKRAMWIRIQRNEGSNDSDVVALIPRRVAKSLTDLIGSVNE